MATTVFPQTDDSVTVAGWASMIAALDRGQADPLGGVSDVTNDSTNLVWSGSDSGFALTDTTRQTFATLPVDKGTSWSGEVNIEIARIDNGGSASDGISFDITVPSGITAYVLTVGLQNASTTNGVVSYGLYTGVTDDSFFLTGGGVPLNNFTTRIYLLLTGDTASGDVLIRLQKSTDSDADDWAVYGRAMLTPIKG